MLKRESTLGQQPDGRSLKLETKSRRIISSRGAPRQRCMAGSNAGQFHNHGPMRSGDPKLLAHTASECCNVEKGRGRVSDRSGMDGADAKREYSGAGGDRAPGECSKLPAG